MTASETMPAERATLWRSRSTFVEAVAGVCSPTIALVGVAASDAATPGSFKVSASSSVAW